MKLASELKINLVKLSILSASYVCPKLVISIKMFKGEE
jgi:hypothetical protein